ncbi:unnamed protein product [Dovyalis caffra]|uniref:Sey1/RHD3-like three-helix bundle domain-containing protein n=1 Tax=Dovyalis caffra TaxID=77055 RepID=A0AAV1RL34_9ROSI|nr:unnamed protein product [Dovyalis caffra]
MLSERFAKYEKQLSDALTRPLESLFEVCKNETKFTMVFNDEDGLKPRSLKILSVMAAIRPDKQEDNIEELLFSLLIDGTVAAVPSSEDRSVGATMDPLAANKWEEEAQELIYRRPSFLWRTAENAGAAAAGTATGVALVAVGPAGAVGGTVELVLAAAATGMRRQEIACVYFCIDQIEGLMEILGYNNPV